VSLRVVEGVSGVWFYHLQHEKNEPGLSLCGKQVMRRDIRLDYWGKTPKNYHIPEKWCTRCPEIAEQLGIGRIVDGTLMEVKRDDG
jgi:hypothetical protein